MARKPKVYVRGPGVDDPLLHTPLMREAMEFSNSPVWEEAMDNLLVPMPKVYEERPELIGQKVTVYRCCGNKHESDNNGCLCGLIGQEVEISGIESGCGLIPSYCIRGSTKAIQECEFVLEEQEYEDGELERVRRVLGHDYVEPEE